MKKPLSLSFFILLTLLAKAQSSYEYVVEKVIDDVYVLKPEVGDYRWVTSNVIVIINTEDVLVVDSGLLPEAATEAIKEIRKLTAMPVKFLLNTHWHGDHWQGNEVFLKEFPGLEIISTEQGYQAMQRNGLKWINSYYPKYFQLMIEGYENDLKKGVTSDGKPLSKQVTHQMSIGIQDVKNDLASLKKIKPTLPTLTFTKELVFRRGGREFQFHYLGVGNTVGDAVLYLPKEKMLIPGDLIVYPSPYESGAFSKEWIQTSKALEQFELLYLIPGHGAVQKDSNYLIYINALFAEIAKQMNDAYLAGSVNTDEAILRVTHESVVSALKRNPKFLSYVDQLDPNFVKAAVKGSFKSIIMSPN